MREGFGRLSPRADDFRLLPHARRQPSSGYPRGAPSHGSAVSRRTRAAPGSPAPGPGIMARIQSHSESHRAPRGFGCAGLVTGCAHAREAFPLIASRHPSAFMHPGWPGGGSARACALACARSEAGREESCVRPDARGPFRLLSRPLNCLSQAVWARVSAGAGRARAGRAEAAVRVRDSFAGARGIVCMCGARVRARA